MPKHRKTASSASTRAARPAHSEVTSQKAERPLNMWKSVGRNDKKREDVRGGARKEQEARKDREGYEQGMAKRQDIMRLFKVSNVVRLVIPLNILCKLLICRRMSS